MTHQTHGSGLSARAMQPVSAELWIFLAFRLAALASWVFLCPPRSSALLAVGLPACAGPRRGCHVPHQSRRERGGCLLYSGVAVSATEDVAVLQPLAQTSSPALSTHYRRNNHPFRRPRVTEPHRRFMAIHPSVLPLARFARMIQALLRLYSLPHTPLAGRAARTHAGVEDKHWTLAWALWPLDRSDLVSHRHSSTLLHR